jgi:hypothetical protein
MAASKARNSRKASASGSGGRVKTLLRVLGAVVGVLASLAGIYALSEPKMEALRTGNHWNGQIKAEPGNGIAVWMYGDTRFRNDSIRSGGFVSSMVITPTDLETADWLPARVATVSAEQFGAHEEKQVSFIAQTRFVQLPVGARYPSFNVKVHFLDQRGAVITEAGKDTPYTLRLSLPSDFIRSFKATAQ